MNLKTHKNIPLVGTHNRPIVTDFIFDNTQQNLPVVIFCHGYKGFKDWGAWQLMLNTIAEQGYFVVTFNFSHNGGTLLNPIDFTDLEAFGNDNFSKQQNDLQSVIDEITSPKFKFSGTVNTENISLIGHSRGGGAAIIKTANESKITKLITLASISTYDTSFLEGAALEEWKKTGVWMIKNGRTQQMMPHYIQFYEDYQINKETLNIQKAAKNVNAPHLLIHGTADTSVTIESAKSIASWNPQASTFFFETDHVFRCKHPWTTNKMPQDLEKITHKIISFLNS